MRYDQVNTMANVLCRRRLRCLNCWLPFPATNRLDDLPDCVDHQLWLLHLDGMAAVRVTNVLRVEKLREAILSGSPRWPCLRASGAKVKSLIRGQHDNGHRAVLVGAVKQIESARVVGRFQAIGLD